MSRHRAYNNYDYDNDLDEYDGFDDDAGGDELSPEDRESMALGTAAVKEALAGEASKVTVAQIQEALWHYYYDVDKSVAYLVSKYISVPADTAKARQKPAASTNECTPCLSSPVSHPLSSAPADQACAAEAGVPTRLEYVNDYAYGSCGMRPPPPISPRDRLSSFFFDMPWLNVPVGRHTIFVPPERPRGGLLGGSGAAPKMSKLQALAAARKKKAAEKKSEDPDPVPQEQMANITLDENVKTSLAHIVKRRKLENSGVDAVDPQPDAAAMTPTGADNVAHLGGDGAVDDLMDYMGTFSAQPARPSAFAQVLTGPASKPRTEPLREFFALPYLAFAPKAIEDAFAGPSPDDKVLAAQAQAGKQKATAGGKKSAKGDKADALADSVQSLKVDDTPLPKSKNLDVLNEYEKSKKKKSASFVVVGHVDAGKSTLMGRLLLDLKVVDERTIHKYRKEAEAMGKASFALAWVLDSRSDERAHGVTIDIATNRFETESTSFTILDAPGHQDFVPNMIAGASQADFAILVIDSSTGAFESGLKGQTREHAQLLRSMGVSRVIVAINKLDTTNWSQERHDEIRDGVSGFLSALGFQMHNISFVPVSGINGDNLVKLSQVEAASWYTGPTLLEELEMSEPLTRALKEPLRMSISDVFNKSQSAVTVGGRIEAGSVQMGDALLVQPSGEKAYVKTIEVDSEPVDWAVAGQSVVMHLSHIDESHVRTGDVVCDPTKPVQCVETFTAKVLAFDHLYPMPLQVHRGRLDAIGLLQSMPAILDNATGAITKKKPKVVKPGSTARVVIKMESKVPLEAGQRVILRCDGKTVAAGLLE